MGRVTRRQFALTAIGLFAARTGHPQQAATVHQIAFLGSGLASAASKAIEALRAGLHNLGYVEGRNIEIDYRWGEGRYERLRNLAGELVQRKAKLMLCWGTPAIRAARQATSTLPIVMVGVGDPVGAGFIKSLAHPGGNCTGVSVIDADLAPKRVALLRELLPKLKRLAVLRNPLNQSAALQFGQAQAAARSLGMEIQLLDARDPKEIESAFAAMATARTEALTVLTDPVFLSQAKLIADLALRGKLPASFGRNENVEAGGLMSYGPRLTDVFREGAVYVDKILQGAKPADLPVQQPTKIALVVNLKTARALGVNLPNEMQIRVDESIE